MKRQTIRFFVGLALSFLLSFLSYQVGHWILTVVGYTGRIPVKVVGGGHTETVMMSSAGYHAGIYFQIPVLILSMLATLYLNDR